MIHRSLSSILITLAAACLSLTLGGCPATSDAASSASQDAAQTQTSDSSEQQTAAEDEAEADELEREQTVAWLLYDSDKDGLPNGLELEFELDPEDPHDGMDIDGDGVLNFRDDDVDGDHIPNDSDPDIDGDGIDNRLDIDIDGDHIVDDEDFDMDGDGIRDEFDWDDDSDGEDDGPDNNEDDIGQLEDEDLRYSVALQAITDKLAGVADIEDEALREKAETQYKEDLRDLLAQVSKVQHEGDPIPVGDKEVELIAKSLANRFVRGGSNELEYDLKSAISNLTPRHGEQDPNEPGTFTDPDPTDAIEAVYDLVMGIEDPAKADAAESISNQIEALVNLKSRLRQKSVTPQDTSKAVTKLAGMTGVGSSTDKVDGLIRVWDVVEEPQLDTLVDRFDKMSNAMTVHEGEKWDWESMVDAMVGLDDLPGVGTMTEKIDGLLKIWEAMEDVELEDLVKGLKDVAETLENHLPDDWGWDVMSEALSGAPGIENGIGVDQINHTLEEVAEIEG